MPENNFPFFREPVALCADIHRDFGVVIEPTYRVAAKSATIPIGLVELPFAALQYPIVFLPETGISVVVDPSGTNSFVDGQGKWRPGYYIPRILQLYPFRLEKIHDQDAGMLLFDAASDRVVDLAHNAEAARLFNGDGEPTTTLQNFASASAIAYWEQSRVLTFLRSLQESGVLAKGSATLNLSNQRSQTVEGFYIINEPAYRALPAETIYRWFQAGWTDAIGLILLSQRNWQNFEPSHNQGNKGTEEVR